MDEELEALLILARKRMLFCEAKENNLRKEITHLRDLFIHMKQDRELFDGTSKSSDILHKKEITFLKKDLDRSQTCLKETQKEAASILGCQQVEMETLQRERDEALCSLHQFNDQAVSFSSYNKFLEEKVCMWIEKLHDNYIKCEIKAEEMVEARDSLRLEQERVKQRLLEMDEKVEAIRTANAELALVKEALSREVQQASQRFDARIMEETADAQAQFLDAAQDIAELRTIVLALQEDMKRVHRNAQYAEEELQTSTIQLQVTNAMIHDLQKRIHAIELGVQNLNSQCPSDQTNSDVSSHQGEAAMGLSGLKIRIFIRDTNFRTQRDNQNVDSLTRKVEGSIETERQIVSGQPCCQRKKNLPKCEISGTAFESLVDPQGRNCEVVEEKLHYGTDIYVLPFLKESNCVNREFFQTLPNDQILTSFESFKPAILKQEFSLATNQHLSNQREKNHINEAIMKDLEIEIAERGRIYLTDGRIQVFHENDACSSVATQTIENDWEDLVSKVLMMNVSKPLVTSTSVQTCWKNFI